MAVTRGRPPFTWTEEIEQEIFRRISSGETVMHICGNDRDSFLPSETTFYARLAADKDFAEEYIRAREAQAHHETDEIKLIADEATPENYNVARLKIDARKWRASKMAPKVYGDRLDLTNSDSTLASKTDKQLMAELAALKAKLGQDE